MRLIVQCTETAIGNMLYAIQNGIITPSTKQRLEELEERKLSIENMIKQEKMSRPVISHDIFVLCLTNFRKYDTTDKDQRQRLVDHFVSVIYLYDDHFDLFLNFREGAVTISFDEKMWKAGKSRSSKTSEQSSNLTLPGSPIQPYPNRSGNLIVTRNWFGFVFYKKRLTIQTFYHLQWQSEN